MTHRLARLGLAVTALFMFDPLAATAACSLSKIADLPITMKGTAPVATVQINGQDAAIVADSGAFYSTLSAAAAAQYKLPLTAAPFNLYMRGVGGETRELSLGEVKSLTIAGVSIPHVDFLVQENDFGAGTVGVMGQNILGVRDAEFDLANGVIRLFDHKDCEGSYLAYWDKDHRGSVVDIQRRPTSNRLSAVTQSAVTEVAVNGVRLRALWDTGAASSTITLRAAKRAGIDIDGPDVARVGASHGFGGRLARTWIAPVASFKVGDEEIRGTRLLVGDFDLDNGDMLLGADFFLSHRVYVANRMNRLYFTYNGGPVFRLEAPPAGQTAASPAPRQDAATEELDADGYSRRGMASAGRKDYARALSDLDRAVSLSPTEARFYYERATIHLQNQQQFLGMSDLDKALALKPDFVDALVARAALKIAGKDAAGARADLDAAARMAPRESNLRMAMGAYYARLNLFAQSVEQYDDWLQFHGEDATRGPALNGRCYGKGLLNMDLDHALNDCNAAVRLMPKSPAALDSRAVVHLRRGDFDRSIADFDAALAIQPRLPLALYGRSLAKAKKGLAGEADADLAAARAMAPDIATLAAARGLTP